MGPGQPLAAVLDGEAEAGEPPVEEQSAAGAGPARPSRPPRPAGRCSSPSGRRGMTSASQAAPASRKASTSSMAVVWPRPSLAPSQPDRPRPPARGGRGASRTGTRSSTTRRRYRWRSWSQVTPMPPWNWTQSWRIAGRMVADVGLGHADQLGGASGDPLSTARAAAPARGVGGLEPHLHVGEPVLERLVRDQRPAERVAVRRRTRR